MDSFNTTDKENISLLDFYIKNCYSLCEHFNGRISSSKIMEIQVTKKLKKFVNEFIKYENKIYELFERLNHIDHTNEKMNTMVDKMNDILQMNKDKWDEEVWDIYREVKGNEKEFSYLSEQKSFRENNLLKEFENLKKRKGSFNISTNDESCNFILK